MKISSLSMTNFLKPGLYELSPCTFRRVKIFFQGLGLLPSADFSHTADVGSRNRAGGFFPFLTNHASLIASFPPLFFSALAAVRPSKAWVSGRAISSSPWLRGRLA